MIYKVVRRLGNNQLVSSWVDPIDGEEGWVTKKPIHWLKYAKGKETVAPDDSLGVWCYKTLAIAERYCLCNTFQGRKFLHAEVWEVEPVGKELSFPVNHSSLSSETRLFYSVILRKKIRNLEK